MIIHGKCETCKDKRWFIRKRKVPTPIGTYAISQKKMCGKCFKAVKTVLKSN